MMMATMAAVRAMAGWCVDKWDGDYVSTTMILLTTDQQQQRRGDRILLTPVIGHG